MDHFIEYCKHCGTVIAQCRCPAKDKTKKYGVCKECQKKNYSILTGTGCKPKPSPIFTCPNCRCKFGFKFNEVKKGKK